MKKIKIVALLTILCNSTLSSFATNQDSLYVSPITFDSMTTIHFYIAENDTITLQVFDRWGHVIRNYFQDTVLTSGSYSVIFLADSLPNGVYFVGLFINSTKHLSTSVYHYAMEISENELINQKQLIYPNPTTGLLTIPYEGVKNVVITDLCGKIIKKMTVTTKTVSLFDLNSGTYIVTITSDKEQLFSTQKIDLTK